MVGKQVDEVSIEQSIIFRAGRWFEKKVYEVSIEQSTSFRAGRWLENK